MAAISHSGPAAYRGGHAGTRQGATGDDPIGALLDSLWALHQGPLFVAAMELWVAGRTDPLLAAEMEKVEPLVNNAVLTSIAQFVPDELRRREVRGFVYTAIGCPARNPDGRLHLSRSRTRATPLASCGRAVARRHRLSAPGPGPRSGLTAGVRGNRAATAGGEHQLN
ncbi:hypothetical protein [Nocardia alni]|uniref:hypothetical protein n=1 Tax=Nocardia alni TaxID=2815723 RepID=UPI001C243CF2|nr:hypothetical protein [Nocardia alni]